jgi:hypothetical protein
MAVGVCEGDDLAAALLDTTIASIGAAHEWFVDISNGKGG